MLASKNNLGTKIISIFVIIAFLSSSFLMTPADAKGFNNENLSPQLLFKRLDNNEDIRNIAMLEYILVSNIFSEEQDIMEWVERKDSITTSILPQPATFDFSRAVFDRPKGLALVPCFYGAESYWCFAKRMSTPNEETGLSYDFTFYTDKEIKEQGAVESLYLLKIDERNEQRAIKMALESEKKHDEKIREAILSNKYMSITEDNSQSLGHIYEFLDVVSPKLLSDFRALVESGQLMVITETADEKRLTEPHAGGQGIYLPKESKYLNPQTIIHEIYAKAGFRHKESLWMEEVFEQFKRRKADAIIDKAGKLPEWMDLSLGQEEVLKLAEFVDLTSVIEKRDYSQNQSPRKPLRVLNIDDDTDHAELLKAHLEDNGFNVTEFLRVEYPQQMQKALKEKEWDVVISDYNMPHFSASGAIRVFKDAHLHIPFILATSNEKLDDIVEMFGEGITDYVNKKEIGIKLGSMIRSHLEKLKIQSSQFQESDETGKYRLMNMLPIGVHILTPQGMIKDINERELELLGYTREEMVGQSIFNFIEEKQRADAINNFHSKMAGKTSAQKKVDRLYVRKDGTTIIGYTQDHFVRNPIGSTIEVITSFEDVTDKRKTERALEESEAKFKEVFTESPIGFVVIDSAGNIFDANPAAVSIIGTPSLGAIMGSNIAKYCNFIETGKGPLYGEAALDYDKLKDEGAAELEKEGRIFVKYSLTPVGVGDESLAPSRYHLQLQDVTQAHEDEAKLKSAYEELEKTALQLAKAEKLSAIGQYTENLANGINNPANNIKSVIEDLLSRMLKGTPVETSEITKVLMQTTEQIARITSETERLQGFARAQTGRMPVSIQDILTDALEVRKFVTKSLNVKVNLDYEEDWSVIIADKVVLMQAFAEMILSAASSMKGSETKELTIRIHNERDRNGKNWVKISFSDTGRGMSKLELDDIWNPFHKDAESGKDAGFGLVIVKDMVNEHGGHIKVDSELGKGTTFTMEFPVIRRYREEIRNFSTLELSNIYGSLWHDLNNTLGAAYILEMLLDIDYEIPIEMENTIKKVVGEVKEIVALIRIAHHNYDSETIFKEVENKVAELKNLIESTVSVEVDPEINILFKDAISTISDNIVAANEKIKEGHRLLDSVHTEDAKEDIYKGLWKALDPLIDDSKTSIDTTIATFNEKQALGAAKKMEPGRKLIMETKYFLDRALSDREATLTKIEASVGEIIPRVEGAAKEMADIISDPEDAEMLVHAKTGLADTVQKIKEVRNMLGIEHSFEEALTEVRALGILNDVVSFFKTSKRFFKQYGVAFDGVEVLSHEVENLMIKADDPAFRYALYNVLSVGLSEDKEDKRKLNQKDRRIDISADRDGTTGEVMFTLRNNYYSFTEEDLKEVDLGGGEKGPAILKWEDDKSSTLAQAHKILASFAGRITIHSDEHGSSIRMFITYIEDAKMKTGEKDVTPQRSADKAAEPEEEDEVLEGWPEEIVKGRPNVIIVDDEEMIRDILKNFLGRDEYNIWCAGDGVEALEIIEKMQEAGEEVHLGLFDISMPRMDGVELTKSVRENEHKFPILVITGHASNNLEVNQLEEDGAIESVIRKPFDMHDLQARVKKLTTAAALAKNEKGVELQMISADKVALIYGENTEVGIKKLRAAGFTGEMLIAKDEGELKDFLTSGKQFDFIVNTTNEDIKDIIKRIFADFETVPEVLDAEDMQLQEKLITICA